MTVREINELIEIGDSLKTISQAYGEIALLKLEKIRSEVERNREFFQEMAAVYRIVRRQATLKKIVLKKTKKTLSILLTSNYHFYGGIDAKVIHLFLETTPKSATDRLVVGKVGSEYLKAMRYFHQFLYMEFKSDLPTQKELVNLSDKIKDYNQIIVFYPQLSTILIQNAKYADITQSSFAIQDLESDQVVANYVIFEPEIGKILKFFENQINIMLLSQTFFEAELARSGSKILAMDQAQTEANKFISDSVRLLAQTKREIKSNRLLEQVSAFLTLKGASDGGKS